jgi:SAM-dependent methyltransferase
LPVREETRDRLVRDAVGWDVENWSRCLSFWQAHTVIDGVGSTALEVGADARNGGISLWLAANGFRVICSGLEDPSEEMRRLHAEHAVSDAVRYEKIDALSIPYAETFDVVTFKSLLGFFGMAGRDALDLQRRAIANMHKALRPGGELWFAENASGTRLHGFFQKRFGWGARGWHYVSPAELRGLVAPFETIEYTTLGVLAVFGRSEWQRRALGVVDRVLCERVTPAAWRYIIAGVARKARASRSTGEPATSSPQFQRRKPTRVPPRARRSASS